MEKGYYEEMVGNYLGKGEIIYLEVQFIDTQLLEIVFWLTQLSSLQTQLQKPALVCRILFIKTCELN